MFEIDHPTKSKYQVRLHTETSNQRQDVEDFIADRFFNQHEAHINEFLPLLLAVHETEGRVLSAAGIRFGSENKFFFENYLDSSAEQALSDRLANESICVKREQIAEIGNLASSNIEVSRLLFQALFTFCSSQHSRWVVFTSCRRLQITFKRLSLPLIKLAEAQQDKLPENQTIWGSYYEDKPAVMAGLLADGKALIPTNSPVHEVRHA